MQLLVIRHGVAVEQSEFARTGKPDSERPLTSEGERKMRRNAKGLARLVTQIDVLATSPLVRARETADIVAAEYGMDASEILDALLPDASPAELTEWLVTQAAKETVAIVGHEPHLATLAAWLISRDVESRLELRKGGACLLKIEQPRAGGAVLQWLMTAEHLRIIGDSE